MSIKEYILSKPDTYSFEIVYLFEVNGKARIDDEYSSGIITAAEFKKHVNGEIKETEFSHYRGYPWIYEDFEIDDSSIERIESSEGQEVIKITVWGSSFYNVFHTIKDLF